MNRTSEKMVQVCCVLKDFMLHSKEMEVVATFHYHK
jgi:hypothetical protein